MPDQTLPLARMEEVQEPEVRCAEEIAAHEFCRLVGIDPWELSDRPGFEGDYNMNWAREQVDHAIAMRAALAKQEATNASA